MLFLLLKRSKGIFEILFYPFNQRATLLRNLIQF